LNYLLILIFCCLSLFSGIIFLLLPHIYSYLFFSSRKNSERESNSVDCQENYPERMVSCELIKIFFLCNAMMMLLLIVMPYIYLLVDVGVKIELYYGIFAFIPIAIIGYLCVNFAVVVQEK
jgi:hypothetical protein